SFSCSPNPRHLPSFPTRRSSDLRLPEAEDEHDRRRLGAHPVEGPKPGLRAIDRPPPEKIQREPAPLGGDARQEALDARRLEPAQAGGTYRVDHRLHPRVAQTLPGREAPP